MPPRSGSTTPRVALAAIAASMAEPPRASTCAPACEASVWLVATIPRSEITIDRACDRSCECAGTYNMSRIAIARMNLRSYQFAAAVLALAGCGPRTQPAVDPGIESDIAAIRAIDNHAHPVRVTAAGEPPDRGFDALPVDNMEPQSDPVNLRPGAPALLDAAHALYNSQPKAQAIAQKGEQYPAWVLDQIGVETMLANRVEMGTSIAPPRFRWVG